MAAVRQKLVPLVLRASTIARAHTYLALAAFLSALFTGCALHYKKIVKNGVAGYPEEWFPSVSATIGDWYPERNIFQLLIALNSGPRFALVALQYYLHRNASSSIPGFLLLVGILRTLSCGGWVYVTSSDDHDVHDVLMISYIVLNIPWMFGSWFCTPPHYAAARSRRRWTSIAFFASLIPMVHFFIQHKVHRIPGAYTRYSFLEWGLILFDILYDSSTELDFRTADLKITIGTLGGGSSASDKINQADASVTMAVQSLAEQAAHSDVTVITSSEKAAEVQHPKVPSDSLYAQGRPVISFLSDLYLSYIYWSVYTALAPTLFYFSVWELGISGQELALLSTLSPIFLGITPFKEWAHTREGRTILHSLSLVGLLAYVSKSPLVRLLLVTFANSAASVGAAVQWFGGEDGDAAYHALVTGLGFLVSSVSKHANHSNNPVWPFVNEQSGGYNKTGIALACLALFEYARRPAIPVTSPSPPKKTASESAAPPAPEAHWLSGAIALGGLIFSLHSLLSDPSTLIAWSWTGYPTTGPVPRQHGSLTHIAQAAGLALAVSASGALAHPLYLAFGAGSACALYAYKDWAGYAGGLGVAAFLMGAVPTVWARARAGARAGGVAKTAAAAWLVVCVFDVASTFTVAYAFVPGGVYFRERTNWVLGAQFACIALAFRWPRGGASSAVPRATLPKHARHMVQYTLALVVVLSLLVSQYRATRAVDPRPHRPASRIVRAGIWTVHFGIDNEGRDSQRRMRDLVRDMELDVVGLLETDLHRVVFGNRDLSLVMAEELGFHVDIGPGPNQHTWGAVLLSKFPIINSTHHLLPSPDGELAPAIEAYLDMFGTEVKVIVAHNGQEETPLDRELQSTALARLLSESYPAPVIFLGYVVTKPHAARPAPYEIMVADGKVHDVDDEDVDRWCEYIFYRGLYRTSYARVSRGLVTDTEMQIGQFVVPRPGTGVTDDSRDARYMRSFKETLPEDHWFPMPYYPELGGKNGHAYHVFNTPLYYKIPQDALL